MVVDLFDLAQVMHRDERGLTIYVQTQNNQEHRKRYPKDVY